MMAYPKTRLRRLRYNQKIRDLVEETRLNVKDLIYPIFVCEGENIKKEIKTLPGQYQLSIDNVLNLCDQLVEKKIGSIILFGLPSKKDEEGRVSHDDNGIVQRAIKEIKKKSYEILIIADLCHCQYTSHGHCGTIVDGDIDNDLTLKNLGTQALSIVKAGVDVIAPSDMMDGRVGKIRKILDKNGYHLVQILSYAVKYASSFYGPFRDAVGSKGLLKSDKKNYQMDYRNKLEALREVSLDIKEGADIVMVKPGMPYLDVISLVKENFKIPVFAYQVSGEYSLINNAIEKKIIKKSAIIESLISFKRAGANAIVTYYADKISQLLK